MRKLLKMIPLVVLLSYTTSIFAFEFTGERAMKTSVEFIRTFPHFVQFVLSYAIPIDKKTAGLLYDKALGDLAFASSSEAILANCNEQSDFDNAWDQLTSVALDN